jgi:outer membrane protein assembly factor BamD
MRVPLTAETNQRRPHGRRRLLPAACAAMLLALMAACSSTSEPEYVERPVEELYNDAMDKMDEGDFRKAAKQFDEVERQHPYSPWAVKAQLMTAYAYYQANEYDDAVVAANRFIELNPASPDVAYAYYLKGLSFYERISSVDRDQDMTEQARKTFEELIARFPESKYARDASLKLELTIDHLAGKEMEIGRFYLRQKFYLAAINRFKTVVDRYQTTTHVPEALLRLTEAYTALGMRDEARKTAAVLGYNFPNSDWYADAYALVDGGGSGGGGPERRSWLGLW